MGRSASSRSNCKFASLTPKFGLDAQACLARNDNDAYGFFAPLGDLVVSGPTLTKVSDFGAILIAHAAQPPTIGVRLANLQLWAGVPPVGQIASLQA